jgi:C1A family cysteine protease
MRKAPDGQWLIRWQNSWGTRWGQNGRAWLCEKNIQGWGFDAYSVSAIATISPDTAPALAL